ncbi:hypothetical protein BG015_008611 [Linnemannia schmuckeri]|uniref:Uncharacterized protein n=1 Tax=Linnemannia schmuckeri TaxID=64567 RepID=A0A9P5S848_9FUNG|nr:hypothetical protein BG015_008611 [Linnemannia schmuckeri]
MFLVLKRLHSLWYLILSLSSLCLIATIVFFSLNLGNVTGIAHTAPLIASIITVTIFAYGLWGKANPYLMPTSSPRSNPCSRSVRHFGTSLLILLWVISTVSYGLIDVLVERLFSGLTLLIAILIVVEAVSSSRLGREQRRILKEEERRVEFELRRAAKNSGSTLVAAATDFRKYKKHSNNSRDSVLGSLDDDSSNGDNALAGIEIVRPEAIDPATVIYNQQVLFESAQRHYHQQYQQYLLHQSRDGGSSGEGEQQEGKYDDILLESSYNEISQVEIQLITETNPFRDQDYQTATELSASAPPYELSSAESSSSNKQL